MLRPPLLPMYRMDTRLDWLQSHTSVKVKKIFQRPYREPNSGYQFIG
jgi:hypothetical protein